MTPEQQAQLREPFPPSQVGVLPQPYKKDSPKGECKECGKWHGLPAMHLDFVGHAAVTDRLLAVDPEWNWKPLALDPQGLPALDRFGNLWIELTIGGDTRLGVGDGASMKVLIGDALRNAAMRFGVALDLWVRGSGEDEKQAGEESIPQEDPAVPGLRSSIEGAIGRLTDEQKADLKEWFAQEQLPAVRRMNQTQCDVVLDHLLALPKIDGDPVSPSPAEVAGAGSPSSNEAAVA